MILHKMRWVAAALLAGGVASTGTALVAQQEAAKPAPAAGAVVQAPAKEDEAALRERDEALKRRSRFNIRTISLALAEYSNTGGFLPPAVLKPREGGPPYSWRVAILPYMDQKGLYDEYRFDEPWDGPNNRKLLARIPDVFRAPGDEKTSTHAGYFALVGPGAIFDGPGGTEAVRGIPDGTTLTIQVVESKRAVPWTKPEDIPFTADDPLPALGGYYGAAPTLGAFHAGFADGHVSLISGDIGDVALRALISKAGGEEIKLP